MVIKGKGISELVNIVTTFMIQMLKSVEVKGDTFVFLKQIDYNYPIVPADSKAVELQVLNHPILSKYKDKEAINDMNAFSHIIDCIPKCITLKQGRHGIKFKLSR